VVAPVPQPTNEKTLFVEEPVPVPTAVNDPELTPVAVGDGV